MAGEVLVRSASSLGGFPVGAKNLPVIEHPMARLDRDNLKVSGGPLAPLGRQRTFVSIDNGELTTGLDRANLPPLGGAAKEWTGRSLSMEVDTMQALIGGSRYIPRHIVTPPEYSPKAGQWGANAGFSHQEVQYMIADRLEMGFHGVKHLFKANDPKGKGVVSKEALLKIIYTICGYVSPDQFSKLLKSIGLNGKTNISFDEFAQCFKNTQQSSMVWLSPAHRVAIIPTNKLLNGRKKYRNGAISAAFCHNLIKDRAKAGEFRVQDVLPEASFTPGGVVIPPQLYDMVTHLGYKLADEEFTKLWHRFDTSGLGVLPTVTLLKRLGLDESGRVRPNTSPRRALVQTLRTDHQRPRPHNKRAEKENKDTTAHSPTEKLVKKTRHVKKTSSAVPRLDRVLHCLHLKFEEPYNLLLQGMDVFDFLKDGFIARIDFKKVLEEFGLPISVIDLDYFLSRCGVRTIHGQIVYRDFLMKFFNRSESGLVHRVVSSAPHLFGWDHLPPLDSCSTMTAEQMEVRLVAMLHSDFLSLMTSFRKCDKYNLGVVTKYEFKACIERLLGYAMDERQYDELLSEVKLDDDGLVPYTAFMGTFNKPPGLWNQRQVAGHTIAAVRQEGTPPEVRSLKAEADVLLSAVRAEVEAEEVVTERELRKSQGMNVQELTDCLADFFRIKFHSFDKVFRSLDRRMTGRFNVHQFSKILKQCDLVLMPTEVDRLWETLPVSSDNMLSFSTLMRYLSTLNKGPPPIRDKLPMEDASDMVEQARRVIRERVEMKQREEKQLCGEPAVRTEVRRAHSKETEQMLERLRPEVMQHWERLKQLLRHLDLAERALVSGADMTEVFRTLQFTVSEPERACILHAFTAQNSGLFNYMDFLKYYTTHQPQPTYGDLNVSSRLEHKLTKDWKSLRRMFRKLDSSSAGYLTVDEFQTAVTSVGCDITREDLFQILSIFDRNLEGKISYEHFLNKILAMPV